MNSFDYKNLKTNSSSKQPFYAITKHAALQNHAPLSINPYILAKGQVITGVVVDLRGREIRIQLMNNEIINALINGDVALSIGDQTSFQIEDTSPNSLLLKIITDDKQPSIDKFIEKALEDANLPKSERNIMIVRELLNQQLSVDKNSILKLQQQAVTFRNASVSTLVLMNKYNIEINEISTTQFEAYRNNEHPLIHGVETLLNSIFQSIDDINTESVTQLQQLLLNLAVPPSGFDTKMEEDFTEPLTQNLTQSTEAIDQTLSSDLRGQLFNLLPPSIQKSPLGEQILSGDANITDVLFQIKEQMVTMNPANITRMQQSSGYKELIKEAILSQWTLTPNKLASKRPISEFYKQLESDLKEVESLLLKISSDFPEDKLQHVTKQTQSLQDNIDFMKTLNQLFTYMQLPLKLTNQNVHSELYVYTKKKNLKADNSSISILLHLDMEQLGPLDIHLELNKRHVNAKIYTCEDSVSLFDEHMPMLYTVLEKKGYFLVYAIHKREREIDLVKDFIQKEEPSIGLKRYTFDIRA